MDEIKDYVDLAEDCDGDSYEIVGVEYEVRARLIARRTKPSCDDVEELAYDDQPTLCQTITHRFPDNYSIRLDQVPDKLKSIKRWVEQADAIDYPGKQTSTLPMAPRLEAIADAHDEMIEIDVPLVVEVQKELVMTVKVPKGGLARASAAMHLDANSINKLIYDNNDLDAMVDGEFDPSDLDLLALAKVDSVQILHQHNSIDWPNSRTK